MSCNPPEELLQSLHPLAEELIAEVVKVLEQLLTRERLDRGGREGTGVGGGEGEGMVGRREEGMRERGERWSRGWKERGT